MAVPAPVSKWSFGARPFKYPRMLPFACLTLAYFVTGKLGLLLATVHPSATAVWAPTGVGIAALLILDLRLWPALLLGAFLVNITTFGTLTTSLLIAAGNSLEGLVAAYLIQRFAGGIRAFETVLSFFRFVVFGSLGGMVSATIGVLTLTSAGLASPANASSIWLTWWSGDTVGALIVTPAILAWAVPPKWPSTTRIVEAAALLSMLLLTSTAVFSDFSFIGSQRLPLEFLCVPFLIWAAVRFTVHVPTTALLVLAIVSITGTIRGFGPFARPLLSESLLLLLCFLGVKTCLTLTLSAAVAERRRAEDRILHMATTDPLTGLANYRALTINLEAEIERSHRTGRPFALLLLDLDKLKVINDQYGHAVGSRALCRLANVLRDRCRTIDTVARYGGDEFAMLLPETDRKKAVAIAARLCKHVEKDSEEPPIRASVGIAVYPEDGSGLVELVGRADTGLYRMKRTPGEGAA